MIEIFYFEIEWAPLKIPARPIQPFRADFFVLGSSNSEYRFFALFSEKQAFKTLFWVFNTNIRLVRFRNSTIAWDPLYKDMDIKPWKYNG